MFETLVSGGLRNPAEAFTWLRLSCCKHAGFVAIWRGLKWV